MNIVQALAVIKDAMDAIGRESFFKMNHVPAGWNAYVADPEDPDLPFFGHGPCADPVEAIIGLAEHIEAHW